MPQDHKQNNQYWFRSMALICQATSHYLGQCWPRPMSPYGITRSQWIIETAWPSMCYIMQYVFTLLNLVQLMVYLMVNTLSPRQNGRRFADTFKRIFLNENVRISPKISLKFVLKVPVNNIPSLVQIMAWRRPGYKPLYEPMMGSILTHICVTRLQWVEILEGIAQ